MTLFDIGTYSGLCLLVSRRCKTRFKNNFEKIQFNTHQCSIVNTCVKSHGTLIRFQGSKLYGFQSCFNSTKFLLCILRTILKFEYKYSHKGEMHL